MIRFATSLFLSISFLLNASGQTSLTRLDKAWTAFVNDDQLRYATAGICVMEAATGKLVFDRNANTGMAPASTQKVLTSIATYEALGQAFLYKTNIGYTGTIKDKVLAGNLVVEGSGDPTFGSWRYADSKPEIILNKLAAALKAKSINRIEGNIIGTGKGFDINPIPDNWMWGDMGNYYGAGVWALNWRENQYDVFLKSGRSEGDSTSVQKVDPSQSVISELIHNEVETGTASTGDASVIYAAPFSPFKLVQGRISSGQSNFKVSGSFSLADGNCLAEMKSSLEQNGIRTSGTVIPPSAIIFTKEAMPAIKSVSNLLTISSPPLDSIIYWFMKKSINLYGETLVRTIGLQKKGKGSTDKGLEWIDSFYTANNFDTRAMHMTDGSGLSPTNRLTPFTLVKALQFAKNRPWFPAFYDALPLYNNMKLKSGTIHRTKCFAGYTGNYIVSIMVNNYNGSSSALVDKIYAVLNAL